MNKIFQHGTLELIMVMVHLAFQNYLKMVMTALVQHMA